MKKANFTGFYETLCDTIENEDIGMYEELLNYCPSFFKLLCDPNRC